MRTFFKRLVAVLLLAAIAVGAFYGLCLVMSHVGKIMGLTLLGKGHELVDFLFGVLLLLGLLFLLVMLLLGSVFFVLVIAGVCNPYGERSAVMRRLRLE